MPRPKGTPRASKRGIDATDKQAAALELRRAGRTFEEIADALGYSNKSGAYKAVMSALQETLREPAEEYRELHRSRLEAIVSAYWRDMQSGNEKAAAVVSRALADLAELDGLNAPKRVEQKLGAIDDRPIPLVIAAEDPT